MIQLVDLILLPVDVTKASVCKFGVPYQTSQDTINEATECNR